jgi:choline dehydrogenase-like flavoprotein
VATISADVVVVGAGVAGAIVAERLARQGLSVVVLEAGPRLDRDDLVARFRRAADKHYMAPYPFTDHAPQPDPADWQSYLILEGQDADAYRQQYVRAVGGTTWHWAAATWRFLPSDFRLRTLHGVGRDWPFDYGFLEPYYAEAEAELGVAGDPDDEIGSPRSGPYPLPPIPLSSMDRVLAERLAGSIFHLVTEPVARYSRPYAGRPPCCGNNDCMPICPIGAQYSGDLHVDRAEAAGARVIPDRVAFDVDAGPDGLIRAVRVLDPQRLETRVEGRAFVLACNGIETPKLMLLSRGERTPDGVANSSGMVGRNLMDHPGVGATYTLPYPAYPGRGPQEITSVVNRRDGPFRSDRCARKYHFFNQPDMDAIARRRIGEGLIGTELMRAIRRDAAHRISVASFHEHLPDPENRVTPAWDSRDALGIPRPRIRYAIGDYVRRGAEETRADFDAIGRLLGAERVEHADGFSPNNHLVGTCIMGDDPRDSVVDRESRTHDHPNLWIAGSATFPAAASVNPTLTIAALSIRIAERIAVAFREAG